MSRIKAPGAAHRRVGLTPFAEARLRRELRRRAPSEAWVDAQIRSFSERGPDGEEVTYRFHDPHAFPPGGPQTAMVRCPACGVFTPPPAMEHDVCLDHAGHDGWGPSPSAVAIRGLQHRHLRLLDAALAPETNAALRREIRQFQKRAASAAERGGASPGAS